MGVESVGDEALCGRFCIECSPTDRVGETTTIQVPGEWAALWVETDCEEDVLFRLAATKEVHGGFGVT